MLMDGQTDMNWQVVNGEGRAIERTGREGLQSITFEYDRSLAIKSNALLIHW